MYAPVVLTVTASGGKYFIDGVEQGFVDLDPGKVYKFDVSDQSMSSHPLALSTTADGTHGGGNEYSDADYSVAQDGTITLFVDDSTPTSTTTARPTGTWAARLALMHQSHRPRRVVWCLILRDMPLTVMVNPDRCLHQLRLQRGNLEAGFGYGVETIKEIDGTTDRTMLVVEKGAGSHWWGGITLVAEYLGTDMIGDGTSPVTMRVYAEQDGNLNLELEADGVAPYIMNQTVTQGWNDVSV